MQFFAFAGLAISFWVILAGFFLEPAMDPIHVRYLLARANVDSLAKALELYSADCGKYPNELQGLVIDDGAQGWQGPYVTKRVPLDPWGRPFLYLRSSGSAVPEILSYGADGKPGGKFLDADISSRNLHRPIPQNSFESHARWIILGGWIGAWFCFAGCIFVLHKTSRPRRQF